MRGFASFQQPAVPKLGEMVPPRGTGEGQDTPFEEAGGVSSLLNHGGRSSTVSILGHCGRRQTLMFHGQPLPGKAPPGIIAARAGEVECLAMDVAGTDMPSLASCQWNRFDPWIPCRLACGRSRRGADQLPPLHPPIHPSTHLPRRQPMIFPSDDMKMLGSKIHHESSRPRASSSSSSIPSCSFR